MSPAAQITCSFGLTFGVPAVLALRELLVLRRRGGGGWLREPEPAPVVPPAPPGQSLPDCLIPKPWTKVPERELELV